SIVLLFSAPRFFPPPTSTLFPYTTLFRSSHSLCLGVGRRFSTVRVQSGAELLFAWIGAALIFALGLRTSEEQGKYQSCTDPCERSEEHTSELQSRFDLVCRLLHEKKK